MATFSQVVLPGIGLTGIVLTGALTVMNASRDQAELEAAEAGLVAVESQLEKAEDTIADLRAEGAELADLRAQLDEAEAAIARLETALEEGAGSFFCW